MKCPKCDHELIEKNYKGIAVDFCENCKGMWLDEEELDALEDKAYDEDDSKGSLMLKTTETEHECPHCSNELAQFQYRINDLELEYCENGHGFWLDEGEEKRVLELMAQREKDMNRKERAEAKWTKTLKRLRSKSFTSRFKDRFR